MQFLTNLNLSQNQIINVVVHHVTSLESVLSPSLGQIVYSTTDNRLFTCTQVEPTIKWTGADSKDAELDAADIVDAINASTSPALIINNAHLQITTDTQNANKIFAGPATGADAVPTFRNIVVADLPSITSAEVAGKVTDETGSGSLVFATSPTLITPKIATITDVNGNETLILSPTVSAVNEVTIKNAGTGNAPTISASGGDDNVSLKLEAKGTGTVQAPTMANGDSTTAIATTAFVNAEIASDAAPLAHVGATGDAHGVVTQSVNGFMSSTDKTKLDGIAEGAEVNQNAYSIFAVSGQTSVEADSKTDTVTLIGGTNVTITTDAVNDTITFTSVNTDTTYSHKVSSQTGGAGIDLDAGGSGSGTDTVQILGDGGTTVTPTSADVITISSHVQNTDTGTTSTTFTLDMDNTSSGVNTSLAFNRGTSATGDASLTWVESNQAFELRADGSNLADLRVENLTVEGELTAINSNEVNIGDSMILLNADVTASSQNSDGGIAVKRLASDDLTRADVELTYNTTEERWVSKFGSTETPLVTAILANKVKFNNVGDGEATSFVLTHNLDTRDASVTIRENASPYAIVYADIEMTTVDTVTVKFALPPALNAYTVTIIG